MIWGLLLAGAQLGLAAHVQIRDCLDEDAINRHVSSHPLVHMDGTRAAFNNGATRAQLGLVIYGRYNSDTKCETVMDEGITSHITISSLGPSEHYHGKLINSSCYTWDVGPGHYVGSRYEFVYETQRAGSLSTFDVTVDLMDANGTAIGCANGLVTPAVKPVIYDIATWFPVLTFFLVLASALWRELSDVLAPNVEEDQMLLPSPNRWHLTRIANCLSYIQFIFFSGALSLRYPGFLQPVVSTSSWSTLMLPTGPILRHSPYHGIQDGIYDTNGTLGGTAGLELMTQVMGAPVTLNTWINIMSLSLILLIFLCIVVYFGSKAHSTRYWFKPVSLPDSDRIPSFGWRDRTWTVLRVFLSYFLFPIISWTSYQLYVSSFLPLYYSMIATLVVCSLFAACWWSMQEKGPQSLGYLIIDSYDGCDEANEMSNLRNFHTLAIFSLLVIRGAATGGLQHYPIAQLLVLLGCEVIQLALGIWVQPGSPFTAPEFNLSLIRFLILIMASSMLPNESSLGVRIVFGYLFLFLHLLVLIGLFIIPSLYQIAKLTTEMMHIRQAYREDEDPGQPQIFGLRQLRRRPTTRTNLLICDMPREESNSPPGSSDASLMASPASSAYPSAFVVDKPRSFLRTLKSRASSADLTLRGGHKSSMDSSGTKRRDFLPQLRPSTTHSSSTGSSSHHGRSDSTIQEYYPQGLQIPSPSNPNVDYSFREADLYYVAPRRLDFTKNTAGIVKETTRRPGILVRLTEGWGRKSRK